MGHFLTQLEIADREDSLPKKYVEILRGFYLAYKEALGASELADQCEQTFITYLTLVKEQCVEPYPFQPYHRKIRTPFDYYAFGNQVVRPLIDLPHSSIQGRENLDKVILSLEKGENAIFLANHQTEADPQAISILLEEIAPRYAEEMIFVAGERVIIDPVAVPISMGRNLLCIYSKRYIDHPPELKLKKQLHNKKTMELMSELLSEGGKAIYVAPSGGRDRRNQEGVFEVAPFDARSIEMLYLMAQRAGHPTHFYPFALKTHPILPPPETVQVELGEARVAKRTPIHLSFGAKIDMEHFPGDSVHNKHERRQARADYIYNLVRADYAKFN